MKNKTTPPCEILQMVVAGWRCACGKHWRNNYLLGKSDEDVMIENGMNWTTHRDARLAKEAL